MSEAEIIALFPDLQQDAGFKITSYEDINYNCIAWALLYTNRWVQPPNTYYGLDGVHYFWPDGINKTNDIGSLVELFELKGYTVCNSAVHEVGYRKVALYCDTKNRMTHAARQLPSGLWTSKIGQDHDIAHTKPEGVENNSYGKVAFIMKKKI